MNNDFQDQDKNGVPVAGQILSANPVSEPSDFFPPTPPVPVKSHSTAKIASAVFGFILLVGGLAAGVTLMKQPQLLNQKASTISYVGTTPPQPVCWCGDPFPNLVPGSVACSDSNNRITGVGHCCPSGTQFLNGGCTDACRTDVECSTSIQISGSSSCKNLSGGTSYCCPLDYVITKDGCKPLNQTYCPNQYLFCSTTSKPSGSFTCLGKLNSSGLNPVKYCCPYHFRIVNNSCVYI